jgi:SNF2 family DNA or RNA helicase
MLQEVVFWPTLWVLERPCKCKSYCLCYSTLLIEFSITLLVTIAEAARSSDERVSKQIPKELKVSRTLILCPPSLIDNWEEEFMSWAPHPLEDNVGLVRKIQSGARQVNRLAEIEAWSEEGGILIIGYQMFRQFVECQGKSNKEPSEARRLEAAKEILLNKPTLIVADEAHTMRNTTAKITQFARLFKSKSRIALTGSPLANNLIEYYTMIDWLAPSYLGSNEEFRAFYFEPIEEGLYMDSTRYEISKSRTKLKVLNELLAPKVHRADISVLKDELKPKTEFVIKISLTEVQHDAYRRYVQAARNYINEDVKATTLFAWLVILKLLCTHPLLYRNKLLEREKGTKKTKETTGNAQSASSDDKDSGVDRSLEDAKLSDAALATSLNLQLVESVNSSTENLEDLSLSHRIKILVQILGYSQQANDKVLVFSQVRATLDFVQDILRKDCVKYIRIDGSTKMSERQKMTKNFNIGDFQIGLISTKAGGQGLNLYGANRVVILDFEFNPSWEEQAIGRAYRIGQQKPVYVYRFLAGGTYEDYMYNTTVYKMQLSTRVVDRKTPGRHAHKKASEMVFEPKTVDQKDLSGFRGQDTAVLDRILATQDM